MYPTNGTVDSGPLVHGGVVYVGSDDQHVYALDAHTGKLVWTRRLGGPVDSSPVLAVLYVGSKDHDVYALNAASGTIKWVRRTGGPVYSTTRCTRWTRRPAALPGPVRLTEPWCRARSSGTTSCTWAATTATSTRSALWTAGSYGRPRQTAR